MRAISALALIVFVASASAMSFLPILGDDKANLQLVFNGFWEQGGLADPKELITCFDDASATLSMNTLGNVLAQLAANKIQQAIQTVQDYSNKLPDEVKKCAGDDPETDQIQKAYGLDKYTPTQLQAKFLAYVTLHHAAYQSQINTMNSQFQKGQYQAVGDGAGKLLKAVLGN
jgi:hypothetical protein